jgi:hypothetical protein
MSGEIFAARAEPSSASNRTQLESGRNLTFALRQFHKPADSLSPISASDPLLAHLTLVGALEDG